LLVISIMPFFDGLIWLLTTVNTPSTVQQCS
jgi:hypothetical protein